MKESGGYPGYPVSLQWNDGLPARFCELFRLTIHDNRMWVGQHSMHPLNREFHPQFHISVPFARFQEFVIQLLARLLIRVTFVGDAKC